MTTPPDRMGFGVAKAMLGDEPVRYFRNCRPGTYCTLQGETVLYFTPEYPDGFDTSDTITRAVVLKYAGTALNGEIMPEAVSKIRAAWATETTARDAVNRLTGVTP